MIPILTVAEMQTVDRWSIGTDKNHGYAYMLEAGEGVFTAVTMAITDPGTQTIGIVCGKGNNGGDGYVAGRLLHENGYQVCCFSLCKPETLTGACAIAYGKYRKTSSAFFELDPAKDPPHFSCYRVIVDALLGTGLTGNPSGFYARVIELLNKSCAYIIAVDAPSGLDGDTGRPGSPTVGAAETVTMGFPQIGHFFYPGKTFTGKLTVHALSYPPEGISSVNPQLFLPSVASLAARLPPRHPAGSKFDHGQVCIIAGSPGMTGSVTLCAEAALRCGCGMIHCALPESILATCSVKLTEPILHSMPVTNRGTMHPASITKILALAASKQAICIGPGLSHQRATSLLVQKTVTQCAVPMLLDADGINAFKDCSETLKEHAGDLVITPHRGEWQRLFGALPDNPQELIAVVRQRAYDFNMTILLKGNPTLIAVPDGTVFIAPYGNSALAKAGSGDVLSGIIVSLLAQGISVPDAALLGTYIHGTAGEVAAKKLTEYSVVARDLIAAIPGVIGSLLLL